MQDIILVDREWFMRNQYFSPELRPLNHTTCKFCGCNALSHDNGRCPAPEPESESSHG